MKEYHANSADSSLAQSRVKYFTAFLVSSNLWVINNGASERITGINDQFVSYSKYSPIQSIQITDGSLSPFNRQGTTLATPNSALVFNSTCSKSVH